MSAELFLYDLLNFHTLKLLFKAVPGINKPDIHMIFVCFLEIPMAFLFGLIIIIYGIRINNVLSSKLISTGTRQRQRTFAELLLLQVLVENMFFLWIFDWLQTIVPTVFIYIPAVTIKANILAGINMKVLHTLLMSSIAMAQCVDVILILIYIPDYRKRFMIWGLESLAFLRLSRRSVTSGTSSWSWWKLCLSEDLENKHVFDLFIIILISIYGNSSTSYLRSDVCSTPVVSGSDFFKAWGVRRDQYFFYGRRKAGPQKNGVRVKLKTKINKFQFCGATVRKSVLH